LATSLPFCVENISDNSQADSKWQIIRTPSVKSSTLTILCEKKSDNSLLSRSRGADEHPIGAGIFKHHQ
jgi:hypothetical protein